MSDEQRRQPGCPAPELGESSRFQGTSRPINPLGCASRGGGRAGSTLVLLSDVDEETLGEALTIAWRLRAAVPAKASAPRSKRKAAPARKAARPRTAAKAKVSRRRPAGPATKRAAKKR